jgi:hypothetical protein
MARKRNKKKPGNVEGSKVARNARVAASWRGAMPRYTIWLAVFAAVTVGLFVYNQFGQPNAGIAAVTGPVFEVSRVCTAASALAVMLALFLGRETPRGRREQSRV